MILRWLTRRRLPSCEHGGFWINVAGFRATHVPPCPERASVRWQYADAYPGDWSHACARHVPASSEWVRVQEIV